MTTSTPSLDDLLATWCGRGTGPALDSSDRFYAAVLDRLADGELATAADLADRTGLDPAEAAQRIEAAATAGWEIRDGAIVGAALTLNPTRHEFTVRGNRLFTWCGFDALFLPILLDERAQVRSTCPVTDATIELTVDPDGRAHDVTPSTAVVAIVGSEVTSCCPTTGPDSDVCTQMPFLASDDAGRRWLAGRSGVAVVDLATATTVARTFAGRGRR